MITVFPFIKLGSISDQSRINLGSFGQTECSRDSVVDRCVPNKQVTIRPNDKPWKLRRTNRINKIAKTKIDPKSRLNLEKKEMKQS